MNDWIWICLGAIITAMGAFSLYDVLKNPQQSEGANFSHDFSVKIGSFFLIALGGFMILSRIL